MADYVSKDDFFNALEERHNNENTLSIDRITDMMAYRAAMLLMTDGVDDPSSSYDTEQLERYATVLKEAGIGNEVVNQYGDEQVIPNVDNLHPEVFLYELGFNAPESTKALDWSTIQTNLGSNIIQTDSTEKSARDMWWETVNNKYDQDILDEPYTKEDTFVYEYSGKDLVGTGTGDGRYYYPHMILAERMGRGAQTGVNVEQFFKENPIDELNLRNTRTVEMLDRGDAKRVCEARDKVDASFTFEKVDDLEQAKKNAKRVLDSMNEQTGKATETAEWRRLKDAVQGFVDAPDQATAAERSAEVLLATESFTKGRKSRWQRTSTLQCVDLALSALSASVPDAPNNPSVQPLVNRFNNVRGSWNPVRLENNGFKSAEKAMSFEEKRLYKQGGEFLRKLRNGEPMTQDEKLKALAGVVAIKESDSDELSPEKLVRRAEELAKDPVVAGMVAKMDHPDNKELKKLYSEQKDVSKLAYFADKRYQDVHKEHEQIKEDMREAAETLSSDFFSYAGYSEENASGHAEIAKLIAFERLKIKNGPEAAYDPMSLEWETKMVNNSPRVAEIAKELVGSKALHDFGRKLEDPVNIAGELNRIYEGKVTAKQWKQEHTPKRESNHKKEDRPGLDNGSELKSEHGPKNQAEQFFEKRPLDTSKMLNELDQKARRLAEHMKTAIETKNGAGLKKELSENIRTVVAMHKVGGNEMFMPKQLNPDKYKAEYQKLENDPAIKLFEDVVLNNKKNYNTFMQHAQNGSDGLEDIVMNSYQKAQKQLQGQNKKNPEHSQAVNRETIKQGTNKSAEKLEHKKNFVM